ncbi:hypothetical protein D4Q76_02305 [archaeon]|nr:MAG: hypothetical protein D4Q76_02305 [archaeon]
MALNKNFSALVSLLFMPNISSIYAFALLFLNINTSIFYLAIAVLFSSVIQSLSLLLYARKSMGDVNVVDRKDRFGLFAVAILSYFVGFLMLKYFSAPFIFTALMLSYLLNTMVAAVITKFVTKVSIHVWGISGPSVAIFYSYGLPGFLGMLFLAAFVGGARIKMRQHTISQVVLSFVLSVPITVFIIYYLSQFLI